MARMTRMGDKGSDPCPPSVSSAPSEATLFSVKSFINWIDSVGVVGLQKHSFRYRAVPHAIS
jgi:hypothetical protein